MNYKLTLQYDGTDFHGWQIQPEKRTVQGELSRVLSLLQGSPVALDGSGRTDAGVHAEGQVASFVFGDRFTPADLVSAINGNLPADVRALEAIQVDDSFHARRSAKAKTYVYRVYNARVMSPFWRRYALHEQRELDINAIAHASTHFLGEHDWTAFSSAQAEVQSRVRTISEFEVRELSDDRGFGKLIEMRITGNGFLRYMVRSIAGAMMAIGRGEIDTTVLRDAISTGRRSQAIVTLPAHGLTLNGVQY